MATTTTTDTTTNATHQAREAARQLGDTARRVGDDVLEGAHKVWLAGLGALSTVGEEGDRLFRELVDKGRNVETRGKERTGEARARVETRVKDVRGRVEEGVRDARERIERRFDGVWGALDERITDVLQRMGVPSRDEIQRLTQRVEELNAKIDGLRGTGTTATTKTARPAATERTVYHVATQDEGWKVELEGATRASSRHDTKDEALTAARELARSKAPATVVVHRKDGTIQTQFSYDEETAAN